MTKKNTYPPWVEKYRTKGHTIKKLKSGYGLYSCTSTYVKGSHPKSVQTYLGMITQKDGFIPKAATTREPVYIEYSLSHFILLNFKRLLVRRIYQGNLDLVYLGIIYFIFDEISLFFLKSSFLTIKRADELFDYSEKISAHRLLRTKHLVDTLLREAFPDESVRNHVVNGLRLGVIEESTLEFPVVHLAADVKKLILDQGYHYE